MTKKIGGWYVSPEDQLNEEAQELAQIVKAKLAGTYTNIEPEVVGGWNISIQNQTTQKLERFADAIVEHF